MTELCDADLHTVINSDTPLSEDHVQFFTYHILRALLCLAMSSLTLAAEVSALGQRGAPRSQAHERAGDEELRHQAPWRNRQYIIYIYIICVIDHIVCYMYIMS